MPKKYTIELKESLKRTICFRELDIQNAEFCELDNRNKREARFLMSFPAWKKPLEGAK